MLFSVFAIFYDIVTSPFFVPKMCPIPAAKSLPAADARVAQLGQGPLVAEDGLAGQGLEGFAVAQPPVLGSQG